MNLDELLSSPLMHRLGWTLVHSLWQAAAVAALLGLAVVLARRRSAQVRYLAAVVAAAAVLILSAATFCLVSPPAPAAPDQAPSATAAVAHQPLGAPISEPPERTDPHLPFAPVQTVDIPPAAAAPAGPEPTEARSPAPIAPTPQAWTQRARQAVQPHLPYAVAAWLLGVVALSLWRTGGWVAAMRLRVIATQPVDRHIQALARRLAGRLKLRRPVRILQSLVVQTPVVIGWLRPVVLLPLSAVTGLAPAQLEAILAHELAHIRRYDYLVNLIQTVVETLFFYHPAVWWISRRLRLERERCCDDVAVEACGNRIRYAEALAAIEEVRGAAAPAGSPRLARAAVGIGAAGGRDLVERIRRVLGFSSNSPHSVVRSAGAILAVGALLTAIVALHVAAGNGGNPNGHAEADSNAAIVQPERAGLSKMMSTQAAAALLGLKTPVSLKSAAMVPDGGTVTVKLADSANVELVFCVDNRMLGGTGRVFLGKYPDRPGARMVAKGAPEERALATLLGAWLDRQLTPQQQKDFRERRNVRGLDRQGITALRAVRVHSTLLKHLRNPDPRMPDRFPEALVSSRERESIAAVIRQLGDDNASVRDKASALLVEYGWKALPQLEAACRDKDLERASRAAAALRHVRWGPNTPVLQAGAHCLVPTWNVRDLGSRYCLLLLALRNVSGREILLPVSTRSCRLEVDGKWYRWSESKSPWRNGTHTLANGEVIEGIRIPFTDAWVDANASGKNAKPLALAPGWHVMRVSYKPPGINKEETDVPEAFTRPVAVFVADVPGVLPPDPVKAARMVEGFKPMVAGIYQAMDANDVATALRLAKAVNGQIPDFMKLVRGTEIAKPIAAAAKVFDDLEKALAAGKVDEAKRLLKALDAMGPGLDKLISNAARRAKAKDPHKAAGAAGPQVDIAEVRSLMRKSATFVQSAAEAMEANQPAAAAKSMQQVIEESRKLARLLKGTDIEAIVLQSIELMKPLQKALADGDMTKAKALWESIEQISPAMSKAFDKWIKELENQASAPPSASAGNGDLEAAKKLLPALKTVFLTLHSTVVDGNDVGGALKLFKSRWPLGEKFLAATKGTPVEAQAAAAIAHFRNVEAALERNDLATAKALLKAFYKAGPQLETAIDRALAAQTRTRNTHTPAGLRIDTGVVRVGDYLCGRIRGFRYGEGVRPRAEIAKSEVRITMGRRVGADGFVTLTDLTGDDAELKAAGRTLAELAPLVTGRYRRGKKLVGDPNVTLWIKRPAAEDSHEAARRTAERFLAAVAASKEREAIRMCDPAGAVPQQIKDFRELPIDLKDLKIARAHADSATCLAATVPFELTEKGRKRTVLIQLTLIRSRGLWVVSDIDLETPQSAKQELDKFLTVHGRAVEIPASSGTTSPAGAWGEAVRGLQTKLSFVDAGGGKVEALLLLRNVSDKPIEVARIARPWSLMRIMRDRVEDVQLKQPEDSPEEPATFTLKPGERAELARDELADVFDLSRPGVYQLWWAPITLLHPPPGRMPPRSNVIIWERGVPQPEPVAGKPREVPWGEVVNGLQCRLLPETQTVKVPEGAKPEDVWVFVTYELRNVGDEPVKFLARRTPLEDIQTDIFTVFAPNGDAVGFWAGRPGPVPLGPQDFMTIEPGATKLNRVRLPYDFRTPQPYRVLVWKNLPFDSMRLVYYGGDVRKARQNPDNVWSGKLKSNTVTVKVVRAEAAPATQPASGPASALASGRATLPAMDARIDELLGQLRTGDLAARTRAAKGLGELRALRAVPGLLAALNDRKTVRFPGPTFSPTIDGKYERESRAPIERDKNALLRAAAARALGQIGDRAAVEALLTSALDRELAVRIGSAVALGKIGDKRAVKPLREVLGYPDGRDASAAAAALGEIGGPEAVEALKNLLLKSPHPFLRQSAIEALAREGGDAAVDAIAGALRDKQGGTRYVAIRALGRVGTARAMAALRKEQQSADPDTRAAIQEALQRRVSASQPAATQPATRPAKMSDTARKIYEAVRAEPGRIQIVLAWDKGSNRNAPDRPNLILRSGERKESGGIESRLTTAQAVRLVDALAGLGYFDRVTVHVSERGKMPLEPMPAKPPGYLLHVSVETDRQYQPKLAMFEDLSSDKRVRRVLQAFADQLADEPRKAVAKVLSQLPSSPAPATLPAPSASSRPSTQPMANDRRRAISAPWISIAPEQETITAIKDLKLLYFAINLGRDATRRGELEIRTADQRRVARFPHNLVISEEPAPDVETIRPGRRELDSDQLRRIGQLADGDYLLAWLVGGRRMSNVLRFRIKKDFDPRAEPLLRLVEIEPGPQENSPLVVVRAYRHKPGDPAPLASEVAWATLNIDGRDYLRMNRAWSGPDEPLSVGGCYAYILRLSDYMQPPRSVKPHRLFAKAGPQEAAKYRNSLPRAARPHLASRPPCPTLQSEPIKLAFDRSASRRWDRASGDPPAAHPATQPADDEQANRIAELIRQLGSEKSAERNGAQQALEKIGQPAVRSLEAATGDKDAERAARAKAALAGIRREAARLALARKGRLCVYLVAEPNNSREAVKLPLGSLKLKDAPLLTDDDFSKYDAREHRLYLTDKAIAKLPRKVGLWGVPFVVVVDGRRWYMGSFYNPSSSYRSTAPKTMIGLGPIAGDSGLAIPRDKDPHPAILAVLRSIGRPATTSPASQPAASAASATQPASSQTQPVAARELINVAAYVFSNETRALTMVTDANHLLPVKEALLVVERAGEGHDRYVMATLPGTKAADVLKAWGQLKALRRELEAALPTRTGKHPYVKKVRERIRDVTDEIWKHVDSATPAAGPAPAMLHGSRPGMELEFRVAAARSGLAGGLSDEQLERYRQSLRKGGPGALREANAPYIWLPVRGDANAFEWLVTAERDGRTYLLVSDRPGEVMLAAARGGERWGLKRAVASSDDSGRPAVRVEFDENGARLMDRLTRDNLRRALAIVVRGEVVSAPTVQARIARQAIITGRFTARQARELAEALRSALPPTRVSSDVLGGAAVRILADFVVAQKQATGKIPPGATEANFVIAFFEGLKATYPELLRVSAEQEKRYAAGMFDDANAAVRAKSAIAKLADAEAALPKLTQFVVTQLQAGKLSGAKLAFAARLLEATAKRAAAPVPGGSSTTRPGSSQAPPGAAKSPDEQLAAARARLKAMLPQGMKITLAEVVKHDGGPGLLLHAGPVEASAAHPSLAVFLWPLANRAPCVYEKREGAHTFVKLGRSEDYEIYCSGVAGPLKAKIARAFGVQLPLPGSELSIEQAVKGGYALIAVCEATDEAGIRDSETRVHEYATSYQRTKILAVLAGQKPAGGLSGFHYSPANVAGGRERTIGKGERVIWIARKVGERFRGVKALADTQANRAAVLGVVRGEQLRANVEQFRLHLSYWSKAGEKNPPYPNLTLYVSGEAPESRPSHVTARISKAQAARIIDHLAASGVLGGMHDPEVLRAEWVGPLYLMGVSRPGQKQWQCPLWGPRMLQHLDSLRKVLDGDAAKAMDKLLAELSPFRRRWKNAPTTPPAPPPGQPPIEALKLRLGKFLPQNWQIVEAKHGQTTPTHWPTGPGWHIGVQRRGYTALDAKRGKGGEVHLWIMEVGYAPKHDKYFDVTPYPAQTGPAGEIERWHGRRVFLWGGAPDWPGLEGDISQALSTTAPAATQPAKNLDEALKRLKAAVGEAEWKLSSPSTGPCVSALLRHKGRFGPCTVLPHPLDANGEAQMQAFRRMSSAAYWVLGVSEHLTVLAGLELPADTKNKILDALGAKPWPTPPVVIELRQLGKDANGVVYVIDGAEIRDANALSAVLARRRKTSWDLVIRAQPNVLAKDVANVIDLAKQLRFRNVDFRKTGAPTTRPPVKQPLDLQSLADQLTKQLGGRWTVDLHSAFPGTVRVLRGRFMARPGRVAASYIIFPFGPDDPKRRTVLRIYKSPPNAVLGANDQCIVTAGAVTSAEKSQALIKALDLGPQPAEAASNGASTQPAAAPRKAHTIGIFLVTEPGDIQKAEKTALGNLELTADPIIGRKDIRWYDWDKHVLHLKPGVADRVVKMRGLNKAFVVVVDGRRLYMGCFTSLLSSYLPKAPTITTGPRLGAAAPKDTIRIDPSPWQGAPDPRSDPVLRAALSDLRLLKPPPATQPVAKWTTPVDGLQTRLTINKPSAAVGERVTIFLDVRNVSDKPINVTWIGNAAVLLDISRDGNRPVQPRREPPTEHKHWYVLQPQTQAEAIQSTLKYAFDMSAAGTYTIRWPGMKAPHSGGRVPPPSEAITLRLSAPEIEPPIKYVGGEWSAPLGGLQTRLAAPAKRFGAAKPILMRLELRNLGSKTVRYDRTSVDYWLWSIRVAGPDGNDLPWMAGPVSTRVASADIEPNQTVVLDTFTLNTYYYMRKPGKYAAHFGGIRARGEELAALPASPKLEIEIVPDEAAKADGDPVGRLLAAVPAGWLPHGSGLETRGDVYHPGAGWSRVQATYIRLIHSDFRWKGPPPLGPEPIFVWLARQRAEPVAWHTAAGSDSLEDKTTAYLGANRYFHVYIHVPPSAEKVWPKAAKDIAKALGVSAPAEPARP